MIKTREDYLLYIKADKAALGRARPIKAFFDEIARFQLHLRRMEYSKNSNNRLVKIFYYCISYIPFRRLSRLLGFSIPINVFGPGLLIGHRGTIVITPKTKIGKNCRMNVGVQIGPGKNGGAPRIGDNCYIGPGAKIFGEIVIGDNVKIGANAVVNKSFPENNLLIVGIPARPVLEPISKEKA